jgi:hypothetical protein
VSDRTASGVLIDLNKGSGSCLQSGLDNRNSKLFHGGIAQLVERQLCKLDVRGSNPLASISKAG